MLGLMRALRSGLAVMLIASTLLSACSKSQGGPAPQTSGPFTASINGTAFAQVGKKAEERNGALVVTLANTALACGTEPMPKVGLVELALIVPDALQSPGRFDIGTTLTSARVSGTTVVPDATAGFKSQSYVANHGTLEIFIIDANRLSAGLDVDATGLRITGSFEVGRCAP